VNNEHKQDDSTIDKIEHKQLLVLTTVVPLIYVQLKIQLQISYLCSVLTTVDPLVNVQCEKQGSTVVNNEHKQDDSTVDTIEHKQEDLQ
jgi:hypothetical protein